MPPTHPPLRPHPLARAAGLVVVALMAVACGVPPGGGNAAPDASTAAPTAAPPPGELSLLVEPDQGVAPIYSLIKAARHSIDLTMYELVDDAAEQALDDAAARGVAVRVILDENREKSANSAARDRLNAHGVHTVWADSRYEATHEKAMVIDRSAAAIMSLNLTRRYYGDTRDFAVLDRQPADVAAIEQVFDADFRHAKTKTPPGNDLVWSPGSQAALVSLVNSAASTLLVENEEMASPAVTAALEKAARRGVRVTVVMTRQDDWAQDFDHLVDAHVEVRTYAPSAALYIHAKAIVADAGTPGRRAFVGSENFSTASFDHNRELGVITADRTLVARLAATIKADAAGASPWQRRP